MKFLPILFAVLLLSTSPAFAEEPSKPEAPEKAEPDVTKLPETTVTETRNPVAVQSLTGRTTVRDQEEIRERGAWTLEEAIQDAPAVTIEGTARYGQEVKVQMRGIPSGFGTQRVLMLLDGRPLTQEYTGNADVAQFPLAAYRRVEITQGPASAAYGSNALGGVVNFLPRRGTEIPVTELWLEGGSFATFTTGFAHGAKVGELDYFLSVDSTSTDGYLENTSGDDMDWSRRSSFLNLGWETERADVRGYLYGMTGTGTDESFDRDLDRWSVDLAFTYHVAPKNDGTFRARAWYQDMQQDLYWFYGATTDYDLATTGLNVTQTWSVLDDHLLTGGGEIYRQQADVAEPAGDVDEAETTWSLFLQDEWTVTDDVRVVAGLRYDKTTGVDGEFSWRLGANWRINEDVTVRGSAGKAFRNPAMSDRYLPTTMYFGMTFEGNPDLGPETLHNAEVGADWAFTEGWSTGATVFASRADDFSDFIMQPDGVFRPDNITAVDVRGFAVTLAGEIGYGFRADAGYTYTDATYEEYEGREAVEGNRVDGNVEHVGTVAFGWRHEAGHGARLAALFSGDRMTDPENTDAGEIDSYVVVDFQAHARLSKLVVLTLNVLNLLDEEYATRPEYDQPGRAAFVGVRVSF
ncbi:MAG: TonB-dependent receptor [Planctomycetota bacterium]